MTIPSKDDGVETWRHVLTLWMGIYTGATTLGTICKYLTKSKM